MQPAFLRALADVVGPAHCLAGAERGPFVVGGRTPGAVVLPGSVDEATRVVQAAAAAGVPVLPWGGGTQMSRGASPPDGALVVVTRRLARVVEHEPGDLTATVEAGITLEALQAALGANGQWLPLDPPLPGRATLGGVLAANASGPRRHLYGTARDLVIGLRVLAADGTLVRAGGKVVKNVAGYDLVKLYIGALGTLGIIVEATLKLRPRPEADRAVWAFFPDIPAAARGAVALGASDLVPHSVELLDPAATALVGEAAGAADGRAASVVAAFDGLEAAVDWQVSAAEPLLRAAGARDVRRLDEASAARALAAVRDLGRTGPEPLGLATVSVPAASVASYLGAAARAIEGTGLRLASAGHAAEGILTLLLQAEPAGERPSAAVGLALQRWREAARALGGHLTVERAPLGIQETVPPWDPPGPALGLMRAIKRRLDPQGLLNPGRFVGGI